MIVKKNVFRIGVSAVALGLLIFFALGTSAPSLFDLPPGLSRSLQALHSAGSALRGWVFKSRGAFEIPDEERIKILAQAAERIKLEAENALLRQALKLGDELGSNPIPADIAGFFREGRDEFILINRGGGQGIKPGQVVIDGNKIMVGTVQAVKDTTATVKLLTSPSSVLEVIILAVGGVDPLATKPLKALSKGNNIRELEIDLVPQGALIGPGQLLFSSLESGQRFLVGEVREVQEGGNEVFLPVKALHLFDPFSSQPVFVLVP